MREEIERKNDRQIDVKTGIDIECEIKRNVIIINKEKNVSIKDRMFKETINRNNLIK